MNSGNKRNLHRVLCACVLSIALSDCHGATQPTKTKIDLPDFPEGAAYILSRLSNEALVNVETSEPVYIAIVTRDGVDLTFKKAAITELAALKNTDRAAQVIEGIQSIDTARALGAIDDLAFILTGLPPDELRRHRDKFKNLSREGNTDRTRGAGYAAIVMADNSVEPAWLLASETEEGVSDILLSVKWIPSLELRSGFFHFVKPMLTPDTDPEILRDAILASSMMAGRETEVFMRLALFIQTGVELDTTVRALLQLPASHWSLETLGELASRIAEWAIGTPPVERNSEPFHRLLQLGEEMANFLPDEQAKTIRNKLGSLGIRVITLRVVPQVLLYDKQHIYVEAEAPVAIVFENSGMMPHNLVITAPGALQEIGIAAAKMINEPAGFEGKRFVPASEKVMWATSLVTAGQSTTLTFTTPESIGDYPYVCTFPGHWVRMNGVMHVVADVSETTLKIPEKKISTVSE